MKKKIKTSSQTEEQRRTPLRVRLPGFITGEEVGLGDLIKRSTSYVGIKPCGGCERRAASLNRWIVFAPRHLR